LEEPPSLFAKSASQALIQKLIFQDPYSFATGSEMPGE
jgi:hypothetical protein